MKILLGSVLFFISILFSGCAKNAVEIQPVDVNQTIKEEHQKYNCSQLEQKYAFLDGKLRRNAEQLNQANRNDKANASTGWLLWGVPYLWLGGNEKNEEAYAQLLGLKEYLQELMISKNCSLEDNTLKVKKDITIKNEVIY